MSANARSTGGTGSPLHGSMAEEAVKLVEVAQLWLAGHGSPVRGDVRDDVWSQATAPTGDHNDALPPECQGCPFCRVRRAVSGVTPEVYGHLADAVASLGAALRAMESGRRDGGRA